MMPHNTPLDLLEKLIAIKSTADRPEALEEVITSAEKYFAVPQLATKKFVWNGKPNLLVFPAGHKGTAFDVVLNAHLDVVPAADELFKLTVKDGKAYGRGVVDMKGASAVLMKVYRDLAQSGQLGSVALTLVTDEEIGGHNGVKPLLEKEKVTGKFFLAGEPTDFGICHQQKGILWLKITEKGKPAHGSKPWEGQNANISLAQKITAFYADHEQPTSKDDWKTSYNLSMVHGGKAQNVVADTAEASLDIRRVQADSAESILQSVRQTFADAKVEVVLDEPCLETNPDNPYIRQLSKAVEQETKQPATFTRETFGSDARFYSAAGIPAVNFGPAGGDMHGDHEWVDVASLDTYYAIVKDFLNRLTRDA